MARVPAVSSSAISVKRGHVQRAAAVYVAHRMVHLYVIKESMYGNPEIIPAVEKRIGRPASMASGMTRRARTRAKEGGRRREEE